MTSLEIYKHASFFKILLFGFSSKLRIPKEFVKKYGEILPHEALLKTDQSGKSWNVKIKQLNEHFYFTNGWPEFVKDNELSGMDFLVFKLVNKSTFQVEIYGKEGILKEPTSSHEGQTSQSKNAAKMRKSKTKKENCESDEEYLSEIKSFTGVIEKRNRYRMTIPRAFARETGISRRSGINLQNAQGEKWRVELYRKKYELWICMAKGWAVFRRANKLFVGTKFRFEFDAISGNLILMETSNKSPANRGRGRPPKSLA